jgi:hypothetical protein
MYRLKSWQRLNLYQNLSVYDYISSESPHNMSAKPDFEWRFSIHDQFGSR